MCDEAWVIWWWRRMWLSLVGWGIWFCSGRIFKLLCNGQRFQMNNLMFWSASKSYKQPALVEQLCGALKHETSSKVRGRRAAQTKKARELLYDWYHNWYEKRRMKNYCVSFSVWIRNNYTSFVYQRQQTWQIFLLSRMGEQRDETMKKSDFCHVWAAT